MIARGWPLLVLPMATAAAALAKYMSEAPDYYALMYAWYMPKDEPSDGLGHRHDWEGVIVWLSDSTSTTADNVVAVCPSAHGGWDCSTYGYTLDGTAALIKYYSIWPVDHQCGLTTTVGGTQPLIA
ncbi:necrosis inducing protein [Penicillium maclennaniae]|uniref:necrosis inducing protein n=1 Tax=Penicillium maclennaniae TaxID=1343394 RepID=UPI0025401024|nr:necrosis inducing protein [Penicillium maclennaniae]KAJ5667679.1 necrosis inducing protein [Penicillium maclennaniae]